MKTDNKVFLIKSDNMIRMVVVLLYFFCSSLLFSQKVILRIDDFGADDPVFYEDLLDVIKENNAKITIAAIPVKQSGEQWTSYQDSLFVYMSNLPYVEIAQHGYSHKNHGNRAEFDERSYDDQYSNIFEGKSVLENRINQKIEIFVPPWNRYDENTLKVLRDLDFRVLSAFVFSNNKHSIDWELISLPMTLDIVKFHGLFRKGKIRRDQTYMVMMHGYNFKENFGENIDEDLMYDLGYAELDLRDLSSMLSSLKKDECDFYHMLDFVDDESGDYHYNKVIENNNKLSWLNLPGFVMRPRSPHIRIGKSVFYEMSSIFIELGFYLLVIAVSLLLCFVAMKSKALSFLCSKIMLSIFLLVLVWSIFVSISQHFRVRHLLMLSVSIGYVFAYLLCKKRDNGTLDIEE